MEAGGAANSATQTNGLHVPAGWTAVTYARADVDQGARASGILTFEIGAGRHRRRPATCSPCGHGRPAAGQPTPTTARAHEAQITAQLASQARHGERDYSWPCARTSSLATRAPEPLFTSTTWPSTSSRPNIGRDRGGHRRGCKRATAALITAVVIASRPSGGFCVGVVDRARPATVRRRRC